MTEMEKLKAGLPYRYDAPELLGEASSELDIQPSFHCDNGRNLAQKGYSPLG